MNCAAVSWVYIVSRVIQLKGAEVMHRLLTLVVVTVLAVTVVSTPLIAHHAFAAQFDRNKPTTLVGAVTKLDWINPHARIFMDVKGADGRVVNWEIELGSPAILMRSGWTRSAVKVGEVVTVNGSLAKDGSNMANASNVTLANGKRVLAGSSGDPANGGAQ
jgi:hypothetical protein